MYWWNNDGRRSWVYIDWGRVMNFLNLTILCSILLTGRISVLIVSSLPNFDKKVFLGNIIKKFYKHCVMVSVIFIWAMMHVYDCFLSCRNWIARFKWVTGTKVIYKQLYECVHFLKCAFFILLCARMCLNYL